MTDHDKCDFCAAKTCHICHKAFIKQNYKVRDHDHRTGKYRGAAHNSCNINYFANRYLPVVFHNLRGYDGHLLIQAAHKLEAKKIDVIPNSHEKLMSFNIDSLRFIDCMQFLSCSLEKLVENLIQPGASNPYSNLTFMKSQFPDSYELLARKGVYPYEWFDNSDKV